MKRNVTSTSTITKGRQRDLYNGNISNNAFKGIKIYSKQTVKTLVCIL